MVSTWSIRKQECLQAQLDIVVSMLIASISKAGKTIWRLLETSLCTFIITDISLGCLLLSITIMDITMAMLMELRKRVIEMGMGTITGTVTLMGMNKKKPLSPSRKEALLPRSLRSTIAK